MKLLCVSNGHGEDVIAVEIVKQLQQELNCPQIAALPLVGEGHAYRKDRVPIVGPVQPMPSGGFIYMDGRQLWQDIRGGLPRLTLAQIKVVRQWGRGGGVILAVGDVVPLLFAWLSGDRYAFVGTAKSEYYLRDEAGWLPQTSKIERWWGSVYYPWERWLMSRPRCQGVFPRDRLTTQILQQWSVPAVDAGNPMMDGFAGTQAENKTLTVLLLPGSRMPEALRNWQQITEATEGVIATQPDSIFLGAIAPALDLTPFKQHLIAQGWQPHSPTVIPVKDPQAIAFTRHSATLWLSQNPTDCLEAADVAIAMAGTAIEQFVGLGKAAIAFPGSGPQFTPAFAEAYTRLLGPSFILVERPAQVAEALQLLLRDRDRLQLIAQNGRQRMGSPGAAARIVGHLKTLDFCSTEHKSITNPKH